mgnify:CR=1 FL=1
MLINPDRVSRLIELSNAERSLVGPERSIREVDAAQLVKATYDDATDAARAAFMTRMNTMPTSAWPWSAFQVMQPRGGGGGGGGVVVANPFRPPVPILLTLILGQAETSDADPKHRIPDRGTGPADYEALYKAFDAWDTKTITTWIGPQGWVVPGTNAGQPKDTGNGAAPPNGNPGPAPTPTPTPPPTGFSWKHPAVLAAGGVTVTVALVAASFYAGRRHRPTLVAAPKELS